MQELSKVLLCGCTVRTHVCPPPPWGCSRWAASLLDPGLCPAAGQWSSHVPHRVRTRAPTLFCPSVPLPHRASFLYAQPWLSAGVFPSSVPRPQDCPTLLSALEPLCGPSAS